MYIPDAVNTLGTTFGLQLRFPTQSSLSYVARLGYSHLNFEALKMGEEQGIPVVNPPLPDFDFVLVESRLEYLKAGLSLEYELYKKEGI